jgi:hypothetical protein
MIHIINNVVQVMNSYILNNVVSTSCDSFVLNNVKSTSYDLIHL